MQETSTVAVRAAIWSHEGRKQRQCRSVPRREQKETRKAFRLAGTENTKEKGTHLCIEFTENTKEKSTHLCIGHYGQLKTFGSAGASYIRAGMMGGCWWEL